jgi:glutamate---cysteine ligase / carboxylate-amine ligase
MLNRGTGADRQLEIFEKEKNLVSVVDYIQSQFLERIAEKNQIISY